MEDKNIIDNEEEKEYREYELEMELISNYEMEIGITGEVI